MMGVYSSLLLAALVLGAPYWLARMATSGRYRAGLWQRLGRVPAGLKAAERMLALVKNLTAQDMVLCLISGGGSALLPLPMKGLTLADIIKQICGAIA